MTLGNADMPLQGYLSLLRLGGTLVCEYIPICITWIVHLTSFPSPLSRGRSRRANSTCASLDTAYDQYPHDWLGYWLTSEHQRNARGRCEAQCQTVDSEGRWLS